MSDLLGELGALEALENALGANNGHNGQNAKGQATKATTAAAAAAAGGKNDTCPAAKTSTITVTQQAAGAAGTGYEKSNFDG